MIRSDAKFKKGISFGLRQEGIRNNLGKQVTEQHNADEKIISSGGISSLE